ncbi:hypothetical protein [Ulvibacterium sp.]|uniref:hypothetical protein n=1 Tax=Ulvibacterium sp. TaxID=2665914 RepID=UPI003BACC068
MKYRLLRIIALALFIISCDGDDEFDPDTEQRMDFDKFTLVTPLNWSRFYPQGTDGFFGGLTNNQDTLYFDYGVFSFSSIDDIKRDSETISYQELRIGGYSSKIVLEKRAGEIDERFSLYTDKKDGENLNRIYCYDPLEEELVKNIFLSHKFK